MNLRTRLKRQHEMDAYDLQRQIFKSWQELSSLTSGESVEKRYPTVPVYVEVDGRAHIVTNAVTIDNKLILKVKENNAD